ncbi:MAG: carbonic anhydrase [Nitrospirae bacterium GWD2_57_9]|nr:MAG: carbonic anhydrase [Nitrospirae bacterium GWD2_57_9]
MKDILKLLNNNKEWAARVQQETPGFFTKLQRQQRPKYLWIGCSDSRVPANQITGLLPGEVFVHRNISNQVINTDMNLMCVLQYAIEILKVRHIIVCGHYGCGGIEAVMQNKTYGLLEHWLDNVIAVPDRGRITLDEMCELNVKTQVESLSRNTTVQKAWKQKRKLYIHGWIYSISNGLIKDLNITKSNAPGKRRPQQR